METKERRIDNLSILILFALIVFDGAAWYAVAAQGPPRAPEIAFLDVGQGDSTLVTFSGGVQVLTDAGPDRTVVRSLENVLGNRDRYIDLAIVSHPQKDHYMGFFDLLERYAFGAFLINGRGDAGAAEWGLLLDAVRAQGIPIIVIGEGDRIAHGNNTIDILAPDAVWVQSGELNDTGIVAFVRTPAFRALLTADIGVAVEDEIARTYDLRAEILKVAHHGSKFSSGEQFLRDVEPKLAVISSGENRFGHPTEEVLRRLEGADAHVFRTDTHGTIRVIGEGSTLKVFASEAE
ncbi:MAG: hypothetical protein HY436_01175 [Candidatus Liptonbacteria bacterium]|nr:hypothetical protein [Candidatus Liptonbacteria bacterium]